MSVQFPKQQLFIHCKRSNFQKPIFETTTDTSKNTPHFFCTVTINNETFTIEQSFSSKKSAEKAVAELACKKLGCIQEPYQPGKNKPREFGISSNPVPPKKQKLKMEEKTDTPKQIHSVTTMTDMLSYLDDETLAGLFKTLLHFIAQKEGDPNVYPKYTSKTVDVGESKYHLCSIDYKGFTFDSLGYMQNTKQAEQSAAEVCLRTLEHLPAVDTDEKYSIQPYKGGYSGAMPKSWSLKTKQCFIVIAIELGLAIPKFKVKQEGNEYTGVIYFEGKIFESETPQDGVRSARLTAAHSAMKQFLGIDDLNEVLYTYDFLKIKHKKYSRKLAVAGGPFVFSPSQQKGWIHHKVSDINVLDGKDVTDEVRNSMIEIKSGFDRHPGNPYDFLLSKEPSFQKQFLFSRSDISVAEVLLDQPNVFVIGNKLFSIKLYCEKKKIFCKNRKTEVDLLPGHRISGLVSKYMTCFPSLQIYLKAECCDDVYFPNPALPVVTSCGAVVMMHDHEAQNSIYVLLKRQIKYRPFLQAANALRSFLSRTISGISCNLNVLKVTEEINQWQFSEVKALSLMTLDSMLEIFSTLWKYDDRCNEIFFKELPEDMKFLKAACQKELERREVLNENINNENDIEWELPKTSFEHRFLSAGVFIEQSAFCMYRGIKAEAGIHIKLEDIERSQFVDKPITDNTNPHRGDVCRYFIWNRFKNFSSGEEDDYLKYDEKLLENSNEKWVDKILTDKNKPAGDKKKSEINPKKKKADTSDSIVKEVKPEAEVKEAEQQNENHESTEKPYHTRNTKHVKNELQWFKVEDAKLICNEFALISENSFFKEEYETLNVDAMEFWRKKRMGLTLTCGNSYERRYNLKESPNEMRRNDGIMEYETITEAV